MLDSVGRQEAQECRGFQASRTEPAVGRCCWALCCARLGRGGKEPFPQRCAHHLCCLHHLCLPHCSQPSQATAQRTAVATWHAQLTRARSLNTLENIRGVWSGHEHWSLARIQWDTPESNAAGLLASSAVGVRRPAQKLQQWPVSSPRIPSLLPPISFPPDSTSPLPWLLTPHYSSSSTLPAAFIQLSYRAVLCSTAFPGVLGWVKPPTSWAPPHGSRSQPTACGGRLCARLQLGRHTGRKGTDSGWGQSKPQIQDTGQGAQTMAFA